VRHDTLERCSSCRGKKQEEFIGEDVKDSHGVERDRS